MLHGYQNKLLRIDLDNHKISASPLEPEMVRQFIGGRGFVAKILYDHLPPGIDAYDPQNIFIAATGPLTGHFLPASGKTHLAPNHRPPAATPTAIWAATSGRP